MIPNSQSSVFSVFSLKSMLDEALRGTPKKDWVFVRGYLWVPFFDFSDRKEAEKMAEAVNLMKGFSAVVWQSSKNNVRIWVVLIKKGR